MSRKPKDEPGEDTTVEVLSTAALEPLPEIPGTMTTAAANAAPRDPVVLGTAKALETAPAAVAPPMKLYRVKADKNITGANGFRALLRVGKVIDQTMYSIANLRSQGVQLEELGADEIA